jgi:MoxR-like ATPase
MIFTRKGVNHVSNFEKLQQIEDYLNIRFFERQEAIRGLLIGLLARQHIFFVGPPGEAKTELAMTLAKLIACIPEKLYLVNLCNPYEH